MASDILNSLIFPTVFALTLVAVFTNRAAELFRLFGYLAPSDQPYTQPIVFTTP